MVVNIIESDGKTFDNNNCELKYPLEIVPLDPVIERELLKDFTGVWR